LENSELVFLGLLEYMGGYERDFRKLWEHSWTGFLGIVGFRGWTNRDSWYSLGCSG
jgi:hypothetical protein